MSDPVVDVELVPGGYVKVWWMPERGGWWARRMGCAFHPTVHPAVRLRAGRLVVVAGLWCTERHRRRHYDRAFERIAQREGATPGWQRRPPGSPRRPPADAPNMMRRP